MGGDGRDLALDAILRVAAPHRARHCDGVPSCTALIIRRHDWREKVREKRTGCFILFVVQSAVHAMALGFQKKRQGLSPVAMYTAYDPAMDFWVHRREHRDR